MQWPEARGDRLLHLMHCIAEDESVPLFAEIVEGRLLLEPAMMHLVVNLVQNSEIAEARRLLGNIIASPAWEDFKESIDALHRAVFSSTKNKFLVQVSSILDDRRAMLFDSQTPISRRPMRSSNKPTILESDRRRHRRPQRNGAEELVADHLMRTLATINI